MLTKMAIALWAIFHAPHVQAVDTMQIKISVFHWCNSSLLDARKFMTEAGDYGWCLETKQDLDNLILSYENIDHICSINHQILGTLSCSLKQIESLFPSLYTAWNILDLDRQATKCRIFLDRCLKVSDFLIKQPGILNRMMLDLTSKR